MKKFFKLGKRTLALFVVVLLNINTYAAIGGNDGSAFVTKAEFDALINTFNEQMDAYQSGLNAKIDGAIANYISGLSSVANMTVTPFYAGDKGVWSATIGTDEKKWVEGRMRVTINEYWDRTSSTGTGYSSLVLNLSNSSLPMLDFQEHVMVNPTNVGGTYYAVYKGYQKNQYEYVTYGNSMGPGSLVNYTSNCYITSFDWVTNGWGFNGALATTTTGSMNQLQGRSGIVQRASSENVFDCLIVTPNTNITTKCFVNERITASDMNRRSSDGRDVHNTSIKTIAAIFPNITNVTKFSGDQSKENNAVGSGDVINADFKLPFLGFNSNIASFNQLVLPCYSGFIDKLKSSGKSNTVSISGQEYIRATDGLPMFESLKDDVVRIPLKFGQVGGEYKNIDIWLKAEAFGADENVKSSTDLIKAENSYNMIPSVYSNAITLDAITGNGEGELRFTMPKDGIVYMKWSLAGNEAAGGGTFYPQDCYIQREG